MKKLVKVDVHCGFTLLGEAIGDSLRKRGLEERITNPVDIIFDADWGFALKVPIEQNRVSIIITDNPCPEYWEDLWHRGSTVLMAGDNFSMTDLVGLSLRADTQFAGGGRIKETPHYESKLTKAERRVYLVSVQAISLTHAEIAKHLFLSEQTVHNYLRSIYAKLGVTNRTQLALHYRGENVSSSIAAQGGSEG